MSTPVSGLDFEALAERFALRVLPRARAATEALLQDSRQTVAGDAAARELLELNFRTKGRLCHVGSCYAAELAEPLVPRMIGLAVGFGALFTLIDTAIDQRGITERAHCERLATWLLSPLAPARGVAPPGIERVLARIGADLHAQLAALPVWSVLSSALRPLLERHVQLIVYQHVEPGSVLRAMGAADYDDVCVDGSPGPMFALMQAALRLGSAFDEAAVARLNALHFPEFGPLHVWADDLADTSEDADQKELNLVSMARARGEDPGALFGALLERYVLRVRLLPGATSALFPLRLLLEEYRQQATEAPRTDAAIADVFEHGLTLLTRCASRAA